LTVIEYDFPTLNEYIAAERGNRYSAASMKKKATLAAKKSFTGLMPLAGLFDVVISWSRKSEMHDPDNVYFAVKFILDGAVLARYIAKDSRKCVRNISHTIFTNRKRGNYCTIEFIEVPSAEQSRPKARQCQRL